MIKYNIDNATQKDIKEHLEKCSNSFVPELIQYVDIDKYSKKICDNSIKFEAWSGKKMIGLIAVYSNASSKIAFITNVSVVDDFKRQGIATHLLDKCIMYFNKNKFKSISLEVAEGNDKAFKFYMNNLFNISSKSNGKYQMKLEIK